MNKENTEKLIRIISLLDKISERNDAKNPKYGKLKSFFSSELSKTFDTLDNQKSVFPLHCENDTRDFSTNQIIDKIKKTKSFFYFNKSYSSERDESSCGDRAWVETGKRGGVPQNETQTEQQPEPLNGLLGGLISEPPTGAHTREQRPRKEDSTERVNNKCTHFPDSHGEEKKWPSIRETTGCVKGSNQGAKTNTTFSFESEGFSSPKRYTGSFHFKRKSQHEPRNYFSDTELLEYYNTNRKKRNLLEILKKQQVRKYKDKLCEHYVDNPLFIATSKKYGNVHDDVEADAYLDHKDLGQLLEKILEHLNVNLKEAMNIYVKEIKKLNKANETLSRKLETAVENNDEQAQEIRDLNKRISKIGEEKTEMNKRIEGYEFTIHKSKKLKNEEQNDKEENGALDMEIKNLKRELNLANSLNDKIKDEKLYLQERIKNKEDKLRREKDKVASEKCACMNAAVSKMVYVPNERITVEYILLSENIQRSSTKTKKGGRRFSVLHRRRNERINSYRSDTILDNYQRVKSKLLESNEKCYFLSKTNLELFRGLKKKRKKIDTLNKQMSYLKYFFKEREKMDRCNEYHLKQENSTHKCDHMESNKSYAPCAEEEYKSTPTNEHNSSAKMRDHEEGGEIQCLEKNYYNLNNEHKMLKKKYELLYKKYVRLLGKGSNKSNELAFKRQKGEENVPTQSDVIHSFYMKRGQDNLGRPFHQGNNLINYIKAKVIHRKNLHDRKFRNYTGKKKKKEKKYIHTCVHTCVLHFYVAISVCMSPLWIPQLSYLF
eukprot:XP_002258772.1 hypothetical protein, conserved in Plasmodium species [Plasmodium knowlesi strain H]